MRKLKTVISCTALAVLCSGCKLLLDAQCWGLDCSIQKSQFESSQESLSKGKVWLVTKTEFSESRVIGTPVKPQTEAEIKENLKSNFEYYSRDWEASNCAGLITDDHYLSENR